MIIHMLKMVCTLVFASVMVIPLMSCSKTKTGVENYQYMYDVIYDWNKKATPGYTRENLFGYGEYLYNSYLILFPRETPSSLNDFYFKWTPGMDVDCYAAYFTCALSDDNYTDFINGLETFSVHTDTSDKTLMKDTTDFQYPAYILQWKEPDGKWEVLEYILTDAENKTVIFVYTMGLLDEINSYAKYNVLPTSKTFLQNTDFEDFSIYTNFESAEYDIDFLKYLN